MLNIRPQLFLTAIAIVALSSCKNDEIIINLPTEQEQWLNNLCSKHLSGRCADTEGGRRAASYIEEVIKDMGYSYEEQSFVFEDLGGKNILSTIKGTCDTMLVIGAHYDGAHESDGFTHYPAANDNASGVVALLSIMSDMKKRTTPTHYTIQFAFWDAEESHNGSSRRGSRYYVDQIDNKELLKFYVNLDCIGYKGDNYLWMGVYMIEAIKKYALEIKETLSIFSLDYDDSLTWDASSDCWSFKRRSIPTVSITDCSLTRYRYPLHTPQDTIDNVDTKRIKKISDALYLFFNI